MEVKKGVLLDVIIASIQAGKYPSQIAREQNISKQNVAYYIRKLKDEGLIKKKGYGVWETNFYSNQVARTIRGHAFMWKVKIPKKIDWKKQLNNSKIKYTELKTKVIRIILNGRKIWLGKKNIVIYEPESFFGSNAIESKKFAVLKLLKIIYKLEEKLKVDVKGKEGYLFSVARQHYSLIKNCLAQQCNEDGIKINVSNQNGLWFLVDNSYNLDEAETVHNETGMLDSIGIQNYFNDHKKHNFKVTPTFMLESINQVTQNQLMFNQNFESHVKAIKTLSQCVKELQKEIRNLKNEKNN